MAIEELYDYDRRMETLDVAIKKLSKKNQQILSDFSKQMKLERMSKGRTYKLLNTMERIVRDRIKKDIDKITKDDLKNFIADVESSDYSVWTKHDYRVIIKKFFSWLEYGDEYQSKVKIDGYPEKIKWIIATVKEKDKPKIQAKDILTEEEINKMINSANTIRDKAFIAVLYETGARISEVGNLKYGDITPDEYGYLLDLTGKTGHRTPRIVMSAHFLSAWLNEHPIRQGNSPLWTTKQGKKLNYPALKTIVKRVARRTGIEKRIHPHLFRHSRATHMLKSGIMNEAQVKVYFGWCPSSEQLSTYSHLVSADANNSLLAMYGINPENENGKSTILCNKCGKVNFKGTEFCSCGYPLTAEALKRMEERKGISADMLGELMKVVSQQSKEIKQLKSWIYKVDDLRNK